MRFGNNYYYSPYASGHYPNHTTYVIGNIELCVNGSYYDLCADQLTPEQALFLCRSTGETYDRAYLSPVIGPINETFSYDPSSDSVANFSCPYSYFSSSCSFDLVYGNGCANNGGVAIISCIRGREHYQYCLNCHLIVPCILACSFGPVCVRKACTYTCYYFASCKLFSMHCIFIWLYTVLICDGLFFCFSDFHSTCNTGSLRLQDQGSGYFNNGSRFVIGRPSVCYNDSYIPYCTEFNSNTARAFCERLDSYYGKPQICMSSYQNVLKLVWDIYKMYCFILCKIA